MVCISVHFYLTSYNLYKRSSTLLFFCLSFFSLPQPLLDILDTSKPKPSSQNLVLALYSYTAQSSDELSFHKGSVIAVLSKEDGEWWKGEVNGTVGLFPSNYVQPLTEQQPSNTEPTRCT